MRVRYHILLSPALIVPLFMVGFDYPALFVAFAFSIFPDIDHLFMGRDIGTFYPPTVYRHYRDLRGNGINDSLSRRVIGFRYPLHNVFVGLGAFFVYIPVGAGLLFHTALDILDGLNKQRKRNSK